MAFSSDGDLWVIPIAGGEVMRLTNHPGEDRTPSWSPDEVTLAFSSDREDPDHRGIWVMPASGEVNNPGFAVRLTLGEDQDLDPMWSPDGTTIAFSRYEADSHLQAIFRISRTGGEGERLTLADYASTDPAWSPDGSRIVFRSNRPPTGQLWIMPSAGEVAKPGTAQQLTNLESGGAGGPAWSPDGLMIAFAVAASPIPEHREIWVAPATGGFARRVTLGDQTSWSPDGRWLAFVRCGDIWLTNDIPTLVHATTWGRLKALFR